MPDVKRRPASGFRVTVGMAPYHERVLRGLACRGLSQHMTPRPLAQVVIDALVFYAAWAEAHPDETAETALRQWRQLQNGRGKPPR